ncbi:Rhodanese-like domain-containing protein [Suillus plorans]|uniref:Rhodanese-like domain-containing protein n=1 Tax=Suillus plorans TaxID=116603 RepID=A0A9P7J9P7_9AGAM|nr:Rhodanese-like domain-containing protein [Suillus plorans]KAG1810108.1 Rhodanese-like domain-containing protein [Suillus plorans]KAG1828707.1 Rhodanese-like domain-containing protein [Suillus variegatus]
MSTPLLLSPSQLQQLLLSESPTDSATKQVSILDSSWFMPNSPRKANEEFQEKRIPGAQFLDLDEVSSPHELGLKHMIPSERHFTDACEEFGIDPTSHVILYDTHGVFSSPRALFMFRAFGHEKSSVLDGGLPRWEAEGFPIEAKPPVRARKSVYPTPVFDKGMIRSYDQMVSNSFTDLHSDSAVELVVDARSRGRFLGTESEPRAGLSSGHIPHSFSLPFTAFLQTRTIPNSSVQYSTFLSLPELRNALVSHVGDHAEAVIQGKRPITTSCGSGMTAGVLWLGLKLLGVQNVALYDESWTGYASRASSKIEKAAN